MIKTKIKQNWKLSLFYATHVFVVLALMIYSCFFHKVQKFDSARWAYFFIVLLTFAVIATWSVLYIKKDDHNQLFKRLMVCVVVLVAFLFTILLMDYKSGDYLAYLKIWFDAYKEGSLKDALYVIVDVSNYTPAYNYFLLIFARLGLNSLYAIKYLTLLFSVLLAFVLEQLIVTVAKTKFEPLRFVCFLILSPILFEYSAWGQCDAIYTSFAMLAFLFALKKKSKLSFLFVGLSFAVKLQFLFVVPVLFVMLIVKDEKGEHYLKWKDIWIAPLMYAVNLVPAFAGRNVLDLLLVYANQTGTDYGVSSNCANVLYFYTLLEDYLGVNVPWLETLLIALFVVITILVLVLILYVVFKRNKIKKLEQKDLVFFGVLFSFAMVFLMPKMLDRFYFIPMAMACVWFFVDKSFSSKIVPVLIHNALYFMMYLTYIDYIKGFISIAISVVAMVSAFVAVGMLIVYTKNKYLDEIKSE